MQLIITNGMSAVHTIQNAGIEGDIISWDDALHDGPVPGGKTLEELSEIRAKYISDIGWGTYEEIHQRFIERDNKLKQHGEYDELTLWFEHDLYDQLQLMQILAWLFENRDQSTKLTVACERKFIAEQDETTIQQMYKDRRDVLVDEMEYAKFAWRAFRAEISIVIFYYHGDPQKVGKYIGGSLMSSILLAIDTYMREFPDISLGLTHSEWTALHILSKGSIPVGQLFRKYLQEFKKPKYLGDSSFALYMSRLSHVKHPLLTFDDGEKIQYHPKISTMNNFWKRKVILTDMGHQVLDRKEDHIEINGIDRWMGGLHLTTENQIRFDYNQGNIV